MSETKDILRFAGDVNVEKIVINSRITGNSFNVANQLIQINIYEDMFSSFITGELTFKESYDFVNAFPFVGEEELELKISTPTIEKEDGGVISGKFYIYKLSDREEYAERNVIYTAKFISIEAIKDVNRRISKAFSGKISDIVAKLVAEEGLVSDKNLILEKTVNDTKYVSNFWTPTRNINYLTEQAYNSNKFCSYVFFENRFGFNFISLDALNFAQPIQTFEYSNAGKYISPQGGSTRVIAQDYSRVSGLKIHKNFDYLDNAMSGVYGSTLYNYDYVTKKYNKLQYSYLDDFYEQVRLNKNPISSSNIPVAFDSTIIGTTSHNSIFTGFGDISNVPYIQSRISRMAQAESFKVNLNVSGRIDYTVGQLVKLNVFKNEVVRGDDDIDDNLDKVISGFYLISSINHIITRERHDCSMELIKDSMILDLNKVK